MKIRLYELQVSLIFKKTKGFLYNSSQRMVYFYFMYIQVNISIMSLGILLSVLML